jgi:hypothetical protein
LLLVSLIVIALGLFTVDDTRVTGTLAIASAVVDTTVLAGREGHVRTKADLTEAVQRPVSACCTKVADATDTDLATALAGMTSASEMDLALDVAEDAGVAGFSPGRIPGDVGQVPDDVVTLVDGPVFGWFDGWVLLDKVARVDA